MQGQIIYIMGVSGSGKSTVGKILSARTGLPFIDADDIHSATNKEKMRAGQALNDNDREDWLHTINLLALEKQKLLGAIIACSALKKKYRKILIKDISQPYWVFLQGSFDLINERMKKRKDHFMPSKLLSSQFEILEIPQDALIIDIVNPPEEIVTLIEKKYNTHK